MNQSFGKISIATKKGQHLRLVFQLPINYFLWLWLQIKKKVKGINRPIVHYYALCWNEEKILPWMFAHYESWVDHYFIYDNNSTDKSVQIVKSHKNATLRMYSTNGFFDDWQHVIVKDNCWKKSRGKADFVIICDMDEFLYHPSILNELKMASKCHASIFKVDGFEMVAEKYPKYTEGAQLTSLVKEGVANFMMDKNIIFDPHRIVDINYALGAHRCQPCGRIVYYSKSLKLLHYKKLGIDYVLDRYHSYAPRISEKNVQMDVGWQYLFGDKKTIDDFYEVFNQRKPVVE